MAIGQLRPSQMHRAVMTREPKNLPGLALEGYVHGIHPIPPCGRTDPLSKSGFSEHGIETHIGSCNSLVQGDCRRHLQSLDDLQENP